MVFGRNVLTNSGTVEIGKSNRKEAEGNARKQNMLERYSMYAHKRPFLTLVLIVFSVLAAVLVVVFADLLKFVETNDREWVILKDGITSESDAAQEGTRMVEGYSSSDIVYERGEESQRGSLFFQFISEDDSKTIFTKANLLAMREIHKIVVEHPMYTKFCHLKDPKPMSSNNSKNDDGSSSSSSSNSSLTETDAKDQLNETAIISYLDICVKPLTAVSVFFPPNGEGELVDDIDAVVRVLGAEENKKLYGYFLDGEFNKETLVNKATRARYPMGAPIVGFASQEDGEREQGEIIGKAILDDIEKELFDRYKMKARFLSTSYMNKAVDRTEFVSVGETASMETRWYAGYLRSKDAANVINFDLAWAFASILAVWGYMAFHTRSFFIASLGMFEIICSFPVALFIYKLIYRIEYLGNVQILSIFVVLGVGADDVFVFYDAFKQSQFEPKETVSGSTLTRVLYTSRRASKAIFVTSFTTMGAFFATSLSEVMPISAFGILSATMIAVLFFINVLMFPPALFLYSLYLEKYKVCCCFQKQDYKRTERYDLETTNLPTTTETGSTVFIDFNSNDDIEQQQQQQQQQQHVQEKMSMSRDSITNIDEDTDDFAQTTTTTTTTTATSTSTLTQRQQQNPMDTLDSEANIKRLRPIERFFRNQFYSFISFRPICYAIVAGFLVLLAVSLKLSLELETPAQQEQWYPTKHLMQAYANDRTRFSVSADDRVVPLDVCFGVLGMNTKKANHWDIKEFGKIILDTTFDITAPESQSHLLDACGSLRIAPCDAAGCQDGLLVMSRPVLPSLDSNNSTADAIEEQTASGVSCFIESFKSYIIEERNLTFPIDNKQTFLEELWRFRADPRFYVYKNSIGFLPYDETKPTVAGVNELSIFFVKVTVQTTLKYPTTAKTARPVYRVWEAWVKTLNEEAPVGMKNAIQTAYMSWTWMVTQEALVRNTFQGVTICFVMAYFVLVLSTMNFLTGAIATVTIAGVVTTVMGVGVRGLMGWELGIGESIAAVILIGLSVDYCVHLANAYTEAPDLFAKTRGDKTRRALMVMGVSITASAMTTIISGSMLWLCVLKFFSKFAFLITMTIASSYLWSILFLPAALILIGPEGNRWSLEPFAHKCKEMFERKCRTTRRG